MVDDTFYKVLAGAILGIVIMGLATKYVGTNSMNDVYKAKEECEKSLPRDQHCILAFKPEGK